MQNQSSLWLDVRRDRPDWIYLQGWGAMNPTAVKEAAKIGFPMNRSSASGGRATMTMRVRPAPEAKGYLVARPQRGRHDFPVIKDIVKYVVDKGKSQSPKDKVGENFYNRGVWNSVLIAEAIRNAQQITGKKRSTARTCGAASRRSTSRRRA